ncbi:uncharacterized protein LOC120351637 [Nilaparvata lugens]|uniref:uncharacterized protein LOC120351637 n=1 Tax=Nilaparvata lugens TaxID=108931 RepID=UPI00193CED47|nr:uncharacterized protein LOC120351637 [Nilaparvata lugens]
MDKSHRASSSSFLLPDSPPPERELNYWEQQKQQKSLSSAATYAATAAASTSGTSSDPLKKQGIFVQDEDSSIIIPDSSPLPQATWAPRRAALTSVPAPKQSVKRGLFVDDDEEPGVLTQSKKRVVDEDSSITPLLREEEEEAENEMETEELLAIINRTEKPWTPLRQLVENTPYPIVAVRQITNQHGRRIILKVHLTASRLTDIYMPERYTQGLTSKDVDHFDKNCKNLCLFVKHVNAFLTDINIVKCKISKFGI